MYYDRTGSVITEEAWKAYWADEEYRLLARTDVGEWTVFRTGLLVPPRQAGYGSPLLSEWRHRTGEAAIAHHDELVARLHGDEAPVRPGVQVQTEAQGCHCH